MPDYKHGISRSNYYSINGIIDVITEVSLKRATKGNLMLHHLDLDQRVQKKMDDLSGQDYEIIIDYKGMRRPALDDPTWMHHEWQVLTYSWLRSKQSDAKQQVAGILFYFNELAPSAQDTKELKLEIAKKTTDILPTGQDLKLVQDWNPGTGRPMLSNLFKEKRSIRIIPLGKTTIDSALKEFDDVVSEIESSVLEEMRGTQIQEAWDARPEKRNCTACDFKTFCPDAKKEYKFAPNVP
jgi:CRISPR/Cas system-associated exonuclease Cas4 (RecB family)